MVGKRVGYLEVGNSVVGNFVGNFVEGNVVGYRDGKRVGNLLPPGNGTGAAVGVFVVVSPSVGAFVVAPPSVGAFVADA